MEKVKLNTKSGQIADLEPNYSFPIVASDTSDVALIGSKIHCNKTGFYNLLLEGNSTPVQKYLLAGVDYSHRVKRLFVTDTDNDCLDGLVGLASVKKNETQA